MDSFDTAFRHLGEASGLPSSLLSALEEATSPETDGPGLEKRRKERLKQIPTLALSSMSSTMSLIMLQVDLISSLRHWLKQAVTAIEARDERIGELEAMISREPRPIGRIVGLMLGGKVPEARVALGSRRDFVVGFAKELDASRFRLGDAVVLAPREGTILGPALEEHAVGEDAKMVRLDADGAMVLSRHGVDFTVRPAHGLDPRKAVKGDTVRYCPYGLVALKVISQYELAAADDTFRLEHSPQYRMDDLVLPSRVRRRLDTVLFSHFAPGARELARAYGAEFRGGFIWSGLPGTGKTAAAGALACELHRLVTGERTNGSAPPNFLLLNGPDLLVKWVGDSEAGLRWFLEQGEKLAELYGAAVLAVDEADSLFTASSGDHTLSRLSNNLISTVLPRLSGIHGRNRAVTIFMTNRLDRIDPRLYRDGRLEVIHWPMPTRWEMERIAALKLGKRPLADGFTAEETAAALVDYLESLSPFVVYQLADGRKIEAGRKDVITGAFLEETINDAATAARLRDQASGATSALGIRLEDLTAAARQRLASRFANLTVDSLPDCVAHVPEGQRITKILERYNP
jgi:ATP-dependent 26S proteasome regulatory subunit